MQQQVASSSSRQNKGTDHAAAVGSSSIRNNNDPEPSSSLPSSNDPPSSSLSASKKIQRSQGVVAVNVSIDERRSKQVDPDPSSLSTNRQQRPSVKTPLEPSAVAATTASMKLKRMDWKPKSPSQRKNQQNDKSKMMEAPIAASSLPPKAPPGVAPGAC